MNRLQKSTTRGFTLIEVLVTSTIAALLVTTTLGLTFRLERQRQAFQRRYQNLHRVELLRTTIRNDLMQCRGVVVGSNEFALSGQLSTDANGMATLQTAMVRFIVTTEGRLYRHEQVAETSKRDLLWVGAKRLETTTAGLGSGSVPSRVRVVVLDDDGIILDMTAMLRAGGMS